MGKPKNTEQAVNVRAQVHNPHIQVVWSTYTNTGTPCQWMDSRQGETWWANPGNVMNKGASAQPPSLAKHSLTEADVNQRVAAAGNQGWTVVWKSWVNVSTPCRWLNQQTLCVETYHPGHILRRKLHAGDACSAGKSNRGRWFTEAELNKRIHKWNSAALVVFSSYKGANRPCQWKQGEQIWWARPTCVSRGIKTHPGSHHDTYARNRGLTREQGINHRLSNVKVKLVQKYGVDCIFKVQTVRDKAHANIDRVAWAAKMKELANKEGVRNIGWSAKAFATRKRNGSLYSSKQERDLYQHVLQFAPDAQHQARVAGRTADIFVPSKNVVVEYNGLYWHSEGRKKGPEYHIGITQQHNDAGQEVIHIWDEEWLKKKAQVLSYLRARLGVFERRLHARKLVLGPLSAQTANNLLDTWHLQGSRHGTSRVLALFDGERPVAVAALAKHHRTNDKWCLVRFACEPGTQVMGALARLSKAARNLCGPLTTWADLRLTNGNSYIKAGWTKDADLPPDYFYWQRKGKQRVVSKQSRMKSVVGTPEGMTEHEHALLDGLQRVYDCGKRRFILP